MNLENHNFLQILLHSITPNECFEDYAAVNISLQNYAGKIMQH